MTRAFLSWPLWPEVSRSLCWLGVCLVTGCGGVSAELAPNVVFSLPHDERVAIYDAENDVVITRSRQDDVAREIAQLKRYKDELAEQWDRTQNRLEKERKSDRVARARAMYEAKRKYLDESLEIDRAVAASASEQTRAATERLNLAKAKQLVRLGSLPQSDIKIFEERVESAQKRVKEANKREAEQRAHAQPAFTAWKDAEEAYARQVADYDSLVWVD